MKWDWKPNESVGVLVFGEAMPDMRELEAILLAPDEDDPPTEEHFAVANEEARVVLRAGKITDVECSVSITFNGIELIGLPIGDIEKVLQRKTSRIHSYEFYVEELGAVFWVEDGVVDSVTVYAGLAESGN